MDERLALRVRGVQALLLSLLPELLPPFLAQLGLLVPCLEKSVSSTLDFRLALLARLVRDDPLIRRRCPFSDVGPRVVGYWAGRRCPRVPCVFGGWSGGREGVYGRGRSVLGRGSGGSSPVRPSTAQGDRVMSHSQGIGFTDPGHQNLNPYKCTGITLQNSYLGFRFVLYVNTSIRDMCVSVFH